MNDESKAVKRSYTMPRKPPKTPRTGRPYGAKTKAIMIVNETRTVEILRLARQGWQCQAIADKLGIARLQVYRLIQAALADAVIARKEEVAHLTELELQRLDAMTKGVSEAAEKGNSRAIDSALKIMDRRAKMLGLDAPTKQEIAGDNGGPLEIRIGSEFSNV